jgi:hypothetical protein
MLPEKFPALSYCDAIISPCGNALPPSSVGFVFIGSVIVVFGFPQRPPGLKPTKEKRGRGWESYLAKGSIALYLLSRAVMRLSLTNPSGVALLQSAAMARESCQI